MNKENRRTNQGAQAKALDLITDLDSIRIELGRVGVHLALIQQGLVPDHRARYLESMRAYRRALDRLQHVISQLSIEESGTQERSLALK